MTRRYLRIRVEVLEDRGEGLAPTRRADAYLDVEMLAAQRAGLAAESVQKMAVVLAGRMWDEVVLMGHAGGG